MSFCQDVNRTVRLVFHVAARAVSSCEFNRLFIGFDSSENHVFLCGATFNSKLKYRNRTTIWPGINCAKLEGFTCYNMFIGRSDVQEQVINTVVTLK